MRLDLQKTEQVYNNYTVNPHAGLTLVMGHPFDDEEFKKGILQEQNAIKEVFEEHGLEEALVLYDVSYQVHATLIELASQHRKEICQELLNEVELQKSSSTNNLMQINYAARWIKKTAPFDIEIGPGVLSEEHSDQIIRITDAGQIVMKGRAKDRKLLSVIREKFERKAGVVHKYGKSDDGFFFVIGYLKPDERVLNPDLLSKLEDCIQKRRNNIKLALKVDSVKVVMYKNFSLSREACLWESPQWKLQQEPEGLEGTLLDTVLNRIQQIRQQNEAQIHQEAI